MTAGQSQATIDWLSVGTEVDTKGSAILQGGAWKSVRGRGWESRAEGALKVWSTLGTFLSTFPGPASCGGGGGYPHMEGLQSLSETETLTQRGLYW